MPRRNRRRPIRRPSLQVEPTRPEDMSTEDMARRLVHRGLASEAILDRHPRPTPDTTSTEGIDS